MLITTIICAVVGVLLLGLSYGFRDRYGFTGEGVICVLIGGCALLGAVLIPAITYGSRAVGRTECSNWGHQTGRPTKFVILTSWDGGTCLTPDNNGKWIPKEQLMQVSNGK